MFCSKCGKELPDEAKFCPACGATTDGTQQTAEKTVENTVEAFTDTADTTAQFAPEDIAQNKGMAILSYLSVLVLIPLFAAKDSRFARFHANQGLVLLVSEVVWSAVTGVLGRLLRAISPFLGFVAAILGLVNLLFLVLAIIGIVNAANGKAKELPLIGTIRLLKD